MDWTQIITSIIAMFSAFGVAWIGHGIKKSNSISNDAIREKFNVIEEKINRQEEKIASIAQCMGRQEAQLETIDKRLRDQESNNLIQQTNLTKITEELDDNNLRTLRLDLLHAIETDPDNVIVIMEMAQKYFIDMKGNCYMSKIFQEWASGHNVSVVGMFNRD